MEGLAFYGLKEGGGGQVKGQKHQYIIRGGEQLEKRGKVFQKGVLKHPLKLWVKTTLPLGHWTPYPFGAISQIFLRGWMLFHIFHTLDMTNELEAFLRKK